jgi:hypothetical protein
MRDPDTARISFDEQCVEHYNILTFGRSDPLVRAGPPGPESSGRE